jgi:biotin carboxylase
LPFDLRRDTIAPMTILCLASYEKGHDFLHECRRQGAKVLLLTSLSLKDQHTWPRESIDELYYMPDDNKKWERSDTLKAIAYVARTEPLDRVVPLDDFDLEMAAAVREHLRIPGMGETTTRYFRDKLAMRMKAQEKGLTVPEFVHILNHDRIRQFTAAVPPPWVLKPRFLAGAIGIKKVESSEQLWPLLDSLGDEQPFYVLERFVPGDVFHVDTIVYENEIRFAAASRYGRPPMEVAHQGGIFTTTLLERGSDLELKLLEKNRLVMAAMGLVRGVSHTEFIVGQDDGQVYFLETSARVGGANISTVIEAASGVNLWAEWAKVELAGGKAPYHLPPVRGDYAGLLISLAKQEWPDTSAYNDAEIVWRLKKKNHVGFAVRSADPARVQQLLDRLTERVRRDFWAYAPPRDKPTE